MSSHSRLHLAIGASVAAFAIIAITVVAPPAPATAEEILAAYNDIHGQEVTVPPAAAVAAVTRDSYTIMPGIPQLAASGTNHDWAKIVLLSGGWPVTEENVTVLLRWMRQENGPNNWWNRNNPLNNGYGSGGGGGTGSYANLVIAAQMAAENLKRHPGYAAIIAGFAASSPTEVTEHAIWFSPWASGHYADGAHWHYSPVPVVKAPASAWGL
ncbi:MAG TPA: hypothetical protein VFS93_01950 [Terrimesophilobacter sp.]|nr:hypothetical protein [Terrimesophilobacter sp.]